MKRDFSALQGEFDLLVCGGGIYGAWTAYDATLRGLKVALVDKGDWASATSSASSKLIHGGLRYLETFDFKLVRKALKERKTLLRVAPHRVWPLRFGVPVYGDSRNGTWKLKAGLMLYDALAGDNDNSMRHRHFAPQAFVGRFPFLNQCGLKGGFTYGDAQTDDARLVLELVAGAQNSGAVCLNYAELTEWRESNGVVSGANIKDVETGEVAHIHARQYVSTVGQWSSKQADVGQFCRLSKGVHLVMPALNSGEALLLTAKEDGRVFFCIPWYGRTLLGTTDTDYVGDIGAVKVADPDVEYLLNAANRYFDVAWKKADVIGAYAGLRVLQQSAANKPSDVTRDWELRTASNRVHHAIGGKITSAREDASVIVDVVCAHLGILSSCETGRCDFPWKPQQRYEDWRSEAAAQASALGVDAESAQWLLRRHGDNVRHVLQMIEGDHTKAGRITPELPLIYADLLYCAQSEMVVHLDDLLRRRLPLTILAHWNEEGLLRIAESIANIMGWSASRVCDEVADALINLSQDNELA
ncbi:MAG: glycerol-3-phosphate dehydrogenase/oxidase [Sideroxydans sp.]|nr:glycerol-3-phosphate dehydrogenase/oxidase [Sideroxydans sp.]